MRVVLQRVVDAYVTVGGVEKGRIKRGLLVYLGVAHDDGEVDAQKLAEKIACLRIFDDDDGKMNLSLKDIASSESDCGVLAVSQFTLLADTRKGRRPSWNGAAAPEKAKKLYEYFIEKIIEQNLSCECGEFQAHMKVTYTNDGPVTIILDSKADLLN